MPDWCSNTEQTCEKTTIKNNAKWSQTRKVGQLIYKSNANVVDGW